MHWSVWVNTDILQCARTIEEWNNLDISYCLMPIVHYNILCLSRKRQAVLCGVQNADYVTGQVNDIADKLEQSESHLGRGTFMIGSDLQDKKSEDKLAKATKDGWVDIVFTVFIYEQLQNILLMWTRNWYIMSY